MSLIPILVSIWLALLAWRRRQIAIPHWKPLAWSAAGGLVLGIILLLVDLEGQKMAARLATPVGIAWMVLAGYTLAALRDRVWIRAAVIGTCWLLLTLGGNAWVGAWMMHSLEAQVPQAETAVRWDAACILGGGTELAPGEGIAPVPELGSAGDRLRVGATLWTGRRVPILVTSGSGMLGQDKDRDLAAETATMWSKDWGIPPEAIVRLPGPVNTSQEIAALAQLARERGWRRVALVTSAWHMPRAMALARRKDLPADPVPCDFRGRMPALSPVYLVPCGSGFEDVQHAINEYLGRMAGR